ncbi:MAG: zinc ribbon domain-containing protein [Candidatus Micrarchaeia archaeon]
MGILDLLLGKKETTRGLWCLRCKSYIPEGSEECPRCHAKVSEMFKITCPNCKKEIAWNAKLCPHCGKSFIETEQTFRCPVCGYEAGYRMNQCPVCNTPLV